MRSAKKALIASGLILILVGLALIGAVVYAHETVNKLDLFSGQYINVEFNPTSISITQGQSVTFSAVATVVSEPSESSSLDSWSGVWYVNGVPAQTSDPSSCSYTFICASPGVFTVSFMVSATFEDFTQNPDYPVYYYDIVPCFGTVYVNPSPNSSQVSLTMGISGQGTISPLPGTYYYTVNSQVAISAVASSGYTFSYWLFADGSKSLNPNALLILSTTNTAEAIFASNTPTPTSTPVPTPIPTPTSVPTSSPTPTLSPTASPTPTPTPTDHIHPTASPTPTPYFIIPSDPLTQALMVVFGTLLMAGGSFFLWLSRRL